MKVTKDFWADEGMGREVFEVQAEVKVKLYAVGLTAPWYATPSLAFLVRDARRQSMAAIEKPLFEGVK